MMTDAASREFMIVRQNATPGERRDDGATQHLRELTHFRRRVCGYGAATGDN